MSSNRTSITIVGLALSAFVFTLAADQAQAQYFGAYYYSAPTVVAPAPVYYAPAPVVYSAPVYYTPTYCVPSYRSFSFGYFGGHSYGHSHSPRWHHGGGFSFGSGRHHRH